MAAAEPSGSMAKLYEDEEMTLLGPLADLSLWEPPSKRSTCERCRRPRPVCWCPFLPASPLRIESQVVVLQHPGEARRCLRTAPMLAMGLSRGKCRVYVGKRFPSLNHHAGLQGLLESPDAILLFPGPGAVPVTSLPTVEQRGGRPYVLVLLDGTWTQAKALLSSSPALHRITQVSVETESRSAYVIRTQPGKGCLSTLEAAARTLAHLEGRLDLVDSLQQPLLALCRFQLEKGAEKHHSKEERIKGLQASTPAPGKRTRRLLARVLAPAHLDSVDDAET